MSSGFTFLEHPADVGIEAKGRTLPEAFEKAAEGLMSVIIDLTTIESRQEKTISLEAFDREQLLVRWLSEILYLYDGQKFLSREIHITEFSPTKLFAFVKGEPFDMKKHHTKLDVKAVTYHQLVVQEDNTGAYVRVYLDI
jgi:SHS2 domain-containing protein